MDKLNFLHGLIKYIFLIKYFVRNSLREKRIIINDEKNIRTPAHFGPK